VLVPVNWLKDYVDIDIDTKTLADAMTMSGTKVEEIINTGDEVKNVVVGKVLEIKVHPNADRLFISNVDVGDRVLQIVTGAQNVKEGDYVPIALNGAVLPGEVKIESGKIRGEASQGMMCSALELSLDLEKLSQNKKEGIFILDQVVKPGTDIREVIDMGDEIIDFEITTNRPDCLSITGIAREVSATLGIPFKKPEIKIDEVEGNIKEYVKGITIEAPDLCYRYAARVVDGIKIEPSPQWMQKRLLQAGMRPINNIVDVTNYVMLEMGQPLHAFDLEKVAGRSIIVRRAQDGEEMLTLDGKNRVLRETDLVIADMEKAVGIAGVMGGENTEITQQTRTILLESANFNSYSIRMTAKKLGLRSEASSRFEKGIDPNLAEEVVNRAVMLMEQLGAGKVVKGLVDEYPESVYPHIVEASPQRVNDLLGTDVSESQMIDILESLEMEVEKVGETFRITVPTFRQDIQIEDDIAEEVARIYGYDKIPKTIMTGSWVQGKISQKQKLENNVKDVLCGCGMYEITTYSFESPTVFDKLRIPRESTLRKVVTIKNPLGEDYSIMRTTLLPAMLNVLSLNYNRGVKKARLYEVAPRYIAGEIPLRELPRERKTISLGMYGDESFYSIKGIIEVLLEELNILNYKFRKIEHPSYHQGRTAEILVDGEILGIIGEIHPEVAEKYQLDTKIYTGELDMELLVSKTVHDIKYSPLPKFPAINRDIAVLLDQDIEAAKIEEIMREVGGELIEKIEFFDVYTGEQIPDGKKSVAYSLVLRAKDRTLKDQDANLLMEKIINNLQNELGARLR